LVLQIGAGTETCETPNLINTDGFLYSAGLDAVIDAHALPFPENTFDYVYSLAVFEHLHSPWQAADEIYRVLKPGGKVYTLVAFTQHLHGYPHHYFNVAIPGARRLFDKFIDVSAGPSPYRSFDELAHILIDLHQMVTNLQARARRHPFHPGAILKAIRVRALRKALDRTIAGLPGLSRELMEVPENDRAWRSIAPGVDIVATKPLNAP
jgi:SAM-dependent methyltransferase